MFDLETFKDNLFYRGGFSAFWQLNDQNCNYSHIYTNASMQSFLAHFPDMVIGMGECFDGFIERHNKSFFIYFSDQLYEPVCFNHLRQIVRENFSFNQQSFYYDEKKSIFFDSFDLYKKDQVIRPLFECISRDHFLEAVVVSVIAEVPLRIDPGVGIEGEGSAFFFRKMFEELLIQGKLWQGLLALDHYGMLDYYLPELNALKGISQDKDYHPEGDAFEHIMECLNYITSRNLVLAWAVLLHDLGKARSQASKTRKFDQHAQMGVPLAKKILSRMRYDFQMIEDVAFLIENHMLPLFVPHMAEKEKLNLLGHPLIKPLFQLFKIDILGSHKDMAQYTRIKHILKKE